MAKDIKVDEILATYLENFLRIEKGDYPRNYYSLTDGQEPRQGTQVLQDSKNKKENTLTPDAAKIIMQIIKSVH